MTTTTAAGTTGEAAPAASRTMVSASLPPMRHATPSALAAALALALASCSGELGGPGAFVDAAGAGALAGDRYAEIAENAFVLAAEAPVSTFSIDADGGSYANARRYVVDEGLRPPADAVRTEEFVNYFDLGYAYPDPMHPLAAHGEVSACPWAPAHRLVRIGLRGAPLAERVATNFVFLVDVSGSMLGTDRLDLLKAGFGAFAKTLDARDRVAIVTYGSDSGVALAPTPGSEQGAILAALDGLAAGGRTAGAAGLRTAYDLAEDNFVTGGNNRVIVGTDGDFNVGPSDTEELVALIEARREAGVFLTVVGVGRGNLNDAGLEQLANRGNGTYEYAGSASDIEKVFIHERSRFTTVAQDVKVRVAFDTTLVRAYRLIGYENRLLSAEDFDDEDADAGELGADQSVTALYEVVPAGVPDGGEALGEVTTCTIELRYRRPGQPDGAALSLPVLDAGGAFAEASAPHRFAAATAGFALLIRQSDYRGTMTADSARLWLQATRELPDPHGYKRGLREMVEAFRRL